MTKKMYSIFFSNYSFYIATLIASVTIISFALINCESDSGSKSDPGETLKYYRDYDDDGYGDCDDFQMLESADTDQKYTALICGDCNDSNPDLNPGATEKCNGIDDDCDSQTDESFPLGDVCDGSDSDGCMRGTYTCRDDGTGVECVNEDPTDIQETPGNGKDDDCDGETDEP